MRLIDAIALKKDACTECWINEINCRACRCIPLIDKQPTINQWIPVSERLPKEYEDVLVTLVSTESGGYTGVAMDCIAYDGKWFVHNNDNVIAWMPLPEPYKESEKE